MVSNTSGRSAFVDNLSRVYWIYALSFAAFVMLAAILEQVGVSNQVLGYLFVLFTLGAYATIGMLTRTMQVVEFYVGARQVPSVYNGMATAAGWISGAVFLGLPGIMFALGWDGLAFILGLGGGFVLIAVLIAPYLRKFGAYTVPDFLALRFGGLPVRLTAVVVLLVCSFAYLTAQIYATGIIAARFLSIEFETAVVIALAAILMSTMLGGIRSLTWSQVAQYLIIIIALLVPAIITSVHLYSNPLPQLALGEALVDITGLEAQLVESRIAASSDITPHMAPFSTLGERNFFAVAICLMLGTASLPHILMRFFTTKSVRQSRTSVAWTLLFLVIVLSFAPVYAAFAKLEIYGSVMGSSVAALPGWIATFSSLGLVEIYGLSIAAVGNHMEAVSAAMANGAGDISTIASHMSAQAASAWTDLSAPVQSAIFNALNDNQDSTAEAVWQRAILGEAVISGNHTARLPFAEFAIDRDAILIAAPEIAGLPFVFAGVIAAGALAAALSTANGLLIAVTNSLSHDIYYRSLDPQASTAKRLVVARALLIVTAVAASWLAVHQPGDIMSLVAWSFSLAAAGFFPALVLGIWWKRASSWGAVAGMTAGFGTALAFLLITQLAPEFGVQVLSMSPVSSGSALLADEITAAVANGAPTTGQVGWFGISNLATAAIGMPVGFVTMIGVSLLTPAPSAEIQIFVDDIRTPRGRSHMEKERAAERMREFGRPQR
ncbi:MAG: VC_2705 family sodium/solute symporter [Rhizobiales bacterium]|nr:VC_2705 family sodium/solute symporter [Hyphomicrobiales bacterium]